MTRNQSRRFRSPLHRTGLALGILLILLGTIEAVAQGATYYVAMTGNDSNPGTLEQPFLTFKKAVDVLQPGDTLYIRGGIWNEQIDLQGPNKSGLPGNYITISGYPRETVTIRYTSASEASYGPIKARGPRGYIVFENLVLDGLNETNFTGWGIVDGNHHFILRNLEIKNFKSNGVKIGADNIQIINCKIHDLVSVSGQSGQRWYGVYHSFGSNNVIEGSEIYNNPGGGLHLYPGPISNLVVRNNSIHDNNTLVTSPVGGVIVQGKSSSRVTNTKIYNNLIYNNGSSPTAGNGHGMQINEYVDGTKVWNNTIYGNKSYGLRVNKADNTVVQNNIIYNNKLENYRDSGAGTIYDHNLTADPKFVNPEASDFRLQPNSPAINKGVTLSQVPTDILGIPRGQASGKTEDRYEIGAYEESASDPNSPAAPISLMVK